MPRAIGTVRAVAGLLLVLVLVGGGGYALGVVGAPAVTDVQNRFAGVNDSTTVVETDVTVDNPNPIGISLGGVTVNYTVDLNEVRLASGTREGVNVSAGSSTLALRTAMDNERIPEWWVRHIRDGERSQLAVHAEVTSATLGRTFEFDPVDREITTDVLSSFNSSETRPVNAGRPLVSDPVLYVNETSANWGSVSQAETPIDMTFVIYNPKSAPYTVTGIGYEITMNEVPVGSGETDRAHVIEPRSTETVEAVTAIDNPRLDEWWVSHVERDQVTDLRIEFYARIELPSGTEIRVPMDAMTYTETIETDIFGTKNGSAGGNASTPTEGTSDGEGTPTDGGIETATEDDETETSTESPTGTDTPTPTETTTDDGGLL